MFYLTKLLFLFFFSKFLYIEPTLTFKKSQRSRIKFPDLLKVLKIYCIKLKCRVMNCDKEFGIGFYFNKELNCYLSQLCNH